MKRRIRWFRMEPQGSTLGHLIQRMIRDEYTDKRGVGFRIESASRSTATGLFVEKVSGEDLVRDPDGNEFRVPRLEFRQVQFQILSGSPNLELIDPPRSCKSFFARLFHLSEGLAVSPIQPDVAAWLSSLEASLGQRVRVRSMAISDVTISTSTYADIIVTSGADVRHDAEKLLSGRKGAIASVDIEWMHHDETTTCELTRSGALCDDHNSEAVGKLLRSALRTTIGDS